MSFLIIVLRGLLIVAAAITVLALLAGSFFLPVVFGLAAGLLWYLGDLLTWGSPRVAPPEEPKEETQKMFRVKF